MIRIKCTIWLILLCSGRILSQDSTWQLTLIMGERLSEIGFQALSHDTLTISTADGTREIWIESIYRIRLIRERSFSDGAKTGAFIGGVSGGLIGVIVGSSAKGSHGYIIDLNENTVRVVATFLGGLLYAAVGSGIGALIGGAVGAAPEVIEEYDLTRMSARERLAALTELLAREKGE